MDIVSFKKKFEKVIVNPCPNQVSSTVTVSVCIQTYQHKEYIQECLDSILIQKTNFDFEILLGDDASIDGTRKICELYAKKFPDKIRLFLHHRENNIKINNQPTGRFIFLYNLYAAQGKYIALCEGDDYWTDPLKLQKQVDFLEANEAFVGVFHNTSYIDERVPNYMPKPWRTYNKDVFTAEDTIRKTSLFHTSSYFFRNLNIDYKNLANKRITSGDMYLLGLISKYGKLKLLNEFMSVYRKNEGGVTSNESLINYHKNRVVLNKALNKYFNYKYRQQAKKLINYHKEELYKIKYPMLYKLLKKLAF
ncbi:glycosyltransferase [Tamlana sp. 2_MG-2023]|uniref:glycosyltransferase family 2 protein n=1 Tax=unclassified Tamlana TaxID=2614803 RepID=UPI0026E300E6|nr:MULTISPECIES: glycosyltransferase [unclassified Tamlana]MDO6758741.1 glycosyltransferase [Tamlana sp. 2_MG-2023]MDO6789440.1 glycosyltransferase [Tamlana sp. 1_MG-2023]